MPFAKRGDVVHSEAASGFNNQKKSLLINGLAALGDSLHPLHFDIPGTPVKRHGTSQAVDEVDELQLILTCRKPVQSTHSRSQLVHRVVRRQDGKTQRVRASSKVISSLGRPCSVMDGNVQY